MAIEAIMKLILMIAVIVVGMAFLMKAFGIDLFGWLESLFGGLGLSDGPALYVRLDTEPKNIFNFQLVNGDNKLFLVDDEAKSPIFIGSMLNFKSYFYLSEFPKNKCTILTAEYNGGKNPGVEKRDRGGVFQVFPGTTLQDGEDGCNNIEECIEKTASPKRNLCDFREATTEADICAQKCNIISAGEIMEDRCASEYSYVDCDPKELFFIGPEVVFDIQLYKNYLDPGFLDILEKKYNYCDYTNKDIRGLDESLVLKEPFDNDQGWKCKGGSCNLLDQNNELYKIKYGIICDPNGNWRVCKPNAKPITGDFGATCSSEGENIFKWSITTKGTTDISCVFPKEAIGGCIFNLKSLPASSSVNVCGKLTVNGKPLIGRKLVLERFDEITKAYKQVITTSETNEDGFGCTMWTPGMEFELTVYTYRLRFLGENAYEESTTEPIQLLIELSL